MLSVLVNVTGDDPALLDTLAALVPGVAEGLVRDVALLTAPANAYAQQVADAAGCAVVEAGPERDERIAAGAGRLRSDWFLVLESGLVPGGDWIVEAEAFLAEGPRTAAGFTLVRRQAPLSAWRANAATSIFGTLNPLQGLVVERRALTARRLPRAVRLAAPVFDRRGRSRLR
jgi:hypothetical protein